MLDNFRHFIWTFNSLSETSVHNKDIGINTKLLTRLVWIVIAPSSSKVGEILISKFNEV